MRIKSPFTKQEYIQYYNFYTHTHTHTRARARARACIHIVWMLNIEIEKQRNAHIHDTRNKISSTSLYYSLKGQIIIFILQKAVKLKKDSNLLTSRYGQSEEELYNLISCINLDEIKSRKKFFKAALEKSQIARDLLFFSHNSWFNFELSHYEFITVSCSLYRIHPIPAFHYIWAISYS